MYRTNEVTLAGEVAQHARANATDEMIDALRALWVSPQARSEDLLDDPWVEETWQSVQGSGQVQRAVALGVELVRGRTPIRPRAFLHVVQNIHALRDETKLPLHPGLLEPLDSRDAELLLDLCTVVLEAGWPREHYLGAIFVRLVEGQAKRMLWPFLRDRLDDLRRDDASWLVTASILCTTSMGTQVDLVDWLADFPHRANVPMWAAALYIHLARERSWTLETSAHLAHVALAARGHLPGDDTETYLLCVELEPVLRCKAYERFLELTEPHAERFASRAREPAVQRHPIIGYLNRLKPAYPIDATDFAEVPNELRLRTTQTKREVHHPIVLLCEEMGGHDADVARTFHLFRELLVTERGDADRIRALYRDFRSFTKPSRLQWMNADWYRILRKRALLGQRISFAIFG